MSAKRSEYQIEPTDLMALCASFLFLKLEHNMSVVSTAGKIAYRHNTTRLPLQYEKVIHQTEKAFLLRLMDNEVWLPKKHVTLDQVKKVAQVPIWLIERIKKDIQNTR